MKSIDAENIDLRVLSNTRWWQLQDQVAAGDWDDDPKSERLAEIRAISNVIQALENLAIQAESVPAYKPVKDFADQALAAARQDLRRRIHIDG